MAELEHPLGADHAPEESYSVGRYRLVLVREAESTYQAGPDRCSEPSQAARFLHVELDGAYQEVMGGLFLNARHRVIGYNLAYRGTLERAAVEPRGLLVPALLSNAAALIAFHNHPSGDPSPSAEDLAFTRRLAEASKVVGVRLLDHIILGEAPQVQISTRRGRVVMSSVSRCLSFTWMPTVLGSPRPPRRFIHRSSAFYRSEPIWMLRDKGNVSRQCSSMVRCRCSASFAPYLSDRFRSTSSLSHGSRASPNPLYSPGIWTRPWAKRTSCYRRNRSIRVGGWRSDERRRDPNLFEYGSILPCPCR